MCLVASKKHSKNQYALVLMDQTIQAEQTKKRTPERGSLIRLLGQCDVIENAFDAIIYKHGLTTVKPKFKQLPDGTFPSSHRDVIQDMYVFSVDPLGCEDIDDALSVKNISESECEVGIHIADVSYYAKECGLSIKNFSTIYAPHRNYDMIPTAFASGFSSLKPETNRLAFSVYIILDKNNGELKNVRMEKNVIRSRKAYSYEEFQLKINNGRLSKTQEEVLYDLGKILYNGDDPYDSHIMIEQFMVLANNAVGRLLREKFEPRYQLFRTHQSTANNVPEDLLPILKILQSKSALYVNGEAEDLSHAGLNRKYYTHFTSPIRRFADLYVHQLLSSDNYKEEIEPLDCNAINDYNRRLKKCERDMNKLHLAVLVDEGKVPNNLAAYILEFRKEPSASVTVYIPSQRMIYDVKVVERKLAHLYSVTQSDDTVTIESVSEGVNQSFTRFEKVVLELELCPYHDEIHKKIRVRIKK